MKTITQFESIAAFSTERLIARQIQPDDLDKFICMNANQSVMASLGGLRDAQQSKDDLERHLRRWQEEGFGTWMFYKKDTKEWIGRGGLRRLELAGHEEVELGYAVMPSFWNHGLATEIAKAVIEIAFEVLRLNDIVCFAEKTNLASQQVMQKAGFQYEKDFTYGETLHALYRLKNLRRVEVVPYDTRWPDYYANEARRIQQVLGSHLREIYHIGSTAIPGMSAKPVIDIILICENLDNIDAITARLNSLNYYNIRRHVIPHRSYFTRRQDEDISYHLHIRERGDPQINRHINFRDYVISHPDDARAYEKLKLKLAEQFVNDINSYVFGKDRLVQEIDARAKRWPGRKRDYLSPNTGPLAKDWTHEKLIKAMEANMNVHMTHFSQYLNQIELIRIPGYTIVNSGLPDDTFNYVLEADFAKPEADRKIAEVTAYFRKKHIPFSWWISPYDKPENLAGLLERHGYINAENNTAMYFDLDAWDKESDSHPELEIIQAKEQKTLRDFAMVLANDDSSFETYFSWVASVLTDDDPIEYFVGYVNGKPVVRGLSCYFAQTAGLYWLSTHPSERNKGYGKAMQAFRLRRAKELGYHIAVLQASGTGYRLYQKLGYKECGVFREFKLKGG